MTPVVGDQLLDVRSMQTVMSQSGTPVKLRADRAFTARVRSTSHRGAVLGYVAAGEHDSHNVIAEPREPREVLVFMRIQAGHARLVQDGSAADLGPGDFGVYASDSPYELHFRTEYEVVGIVVPTQRLATVGLDIGSLLGRRIPGENPVVASLGHIVDGLERGARDAPNALKSRFVDQALETVETLGRYWVVAEGGANARYLERALEFIDENLGDADLKPATVAAALFVSVRTLYSAFESSGISIAAMIRERRLERCRKDLADPVHFDEPVASIGARWGFTSPSYFSAVFLRGTGLSPREFRQRAIAGSADQ